MQLFERQMTKRTKRRVPIMNSEMDFSRQNLEQKRPVFLQHAQHSGSREITHTWWGGEGFPGDVGALEGVVMVMMKEKCLLYAIFYASILVLVWSKRAFLQTSTKMNA